MANKVVNLLGTAKLLGTTLEGSAGNDILLGGRNNDILIGGAGADFLNGGLGTDTADYSGSSTGVTVNLITGKGFGGDAQGDTLLSIENAIGSAYADTLTGNNGNNVLTGGDGTDTFVVTKGNDVINDFSPAPNTETPLLIDFEGGAGGGFIGIPNGYNGLNWNSLEFTGGSHYLGALTSGVNVGTPGGSFVLASFGSSTQHFDLNSGHFSVGIIGGNYAIEGWRDGVRVGSVTLAINPLDPDFINFQTQTASGSLGAQNAIFTGTFDDISEVRMFRTTGPSNFLSMDDLQLTMLGGDGDRIDVPAGTNIADLVASAASNGHGGTILTHATGTLELLGVAPASVSADWFV